MMAIKLKPQEIYLLKLKSICLQQIILFTIGVKNELKLLVTLSLKTIKKITITSINLFRIKTLVKQVAQIQR